jgi:sensor histidine kinase YesM
MKETAYIPNDRKLRLIGIPLAGILIPAMINFEGFLSLSPDYVVNVLFSTLITLVLWEGNRAIIIYMFRKFPDHSQNTRRVLYESGLGLLYVLVISVFLNETICKPYFQYDAFLITFRISIVPTTIVFLIYEAVYFFESWKMNVRKSESLMREGVQSQLEVLKNQLDPHFLFNSMNTLAALIDDENTNAQDYLERLSDVYRYVLVSRSKDTVTVEEEIAFVDAYVYLNKIRFRDNLLVSKELSAETLQQHVTPLSLQMLVENAIKHNVTSRENPLTITIREDSDAYLVVENNILEKTTLEKSTRVGLQNIINRYSLLSERRVEIIRQKGLFTVRIPLLPHLA